MNKPPTRSSSETKTPSLGELMGVMTFTVGFVPAWLYATGWAYAYHYFDRFGVPLMMVDIPREYYFIYGATVVRQFPLWDLAIVMVAIAALALWPLSNVTYGRIDPPWLGEALRRATPALCAIALTATFWLGHLAAIAAAHREYALQRQSDYSAFPRAQIWPKDAAASLSNDARTPNSLAWASADLTNGCYRLLLQNRDRLFLFRPVRDVAAADLPVLITPADKIGLIRVLPDYTSCP
jgi:hypothetical protein